MGSVSIIYFHLLTFKIVDVLNVEMVNSFKQLVICTDLSSENKIHLSYSVILIIHQDEMELFNIQVCLSGLIEFKAL